jgi:4,5-DOPA dioxygenase extradiol
MALDRRTLLKMAVGAAAASACSRPAVPRKESAAVTPEAPKPARMPLLFVGHGSPMNAIEDNEWSRGFKALAKQLPTPKMILAVSAHWFVPGIYATSNEKPPTIHDFGGFPEELFAMEYPAPGSLDLAKRVIKLVGESHSRLNGDWGLDHGTWTVLHHLRPAADIPVVQLSIDQTVPPKFHADLGKMISPLRDEGVLIIGSGNATHNLRFAFQSIQSGDRTTPAWASRFDADVAKAMERHDPKLLVDAVAMDHGKMSHPTLDHYLPMLYVLGAADVNDKASFPITGFDAGSLSMRSVIFS